MFFSFFKKTKKHKKNLLHHLETLLITGIVIGLISTGSFLLWASSLHIPDLSSLHQRKVAQSTKIYDRTGKILLFDVHKDIKRTLIPFEKISPHVINAAIAIEDENFYEHIGIRPQAIVRAILTNLSNKDLLGGQGGSTITQQVIKNSVLTSEKKISRKLKEWVLAIKLEQTFSKNQIMELYLNETPYGGNLYGVEEAAQAYFATSTNAVTIAQAAYLAALPQAPTFYSPYGSNKDSLDRRKNLVIDRMLENGFITLEEYNDALKEEVVFQTQRSTGIKAPHFVMFVREYLAEKYGERAIEERGFKVITTLDYELQEKAQEIVARFAKENTKKFEATNAGMIAIDPHTGEILVMVGSRNYFDEEIEGNFNITTAHRQPGSAFKPFVYATAINKGYTTETVVFDVRTQFSTTCEIEKLVSDENCYSPGNYDNVFRGPVTMRKALAQSINIPAVKFLYLSGIYDSLQTAKAMGIHSLTDINQYGLTLVLGGGEVALLDMTSAYGVFANEGIRNPPVSILQIKDNKGNLVEEFQKRPNRVLDKQTALWISDMLSDNEARTPAFGARSDLYFPGRDVAAKTGTTNDYRDAWIVGYTPKIAVGAWAGNNDNSPMNKKVAGFVVAPMWNEFMYSAFENIEDEKFERPEPLTIDLLKPILRGVWEGESSYYIDTISGKLATEFTPMETREQKFITDVHSILYWIDKKNPRGPRLVNPENDFQYDYWEYAVNEWKIENGYSVATTSATTSSQTITSGIPTEFDDVHKPEYQPKVNLSSFDNNAIYLPNEIIAIIPSIEPNKFPISRIDYFLNNSFIDSIKVAPFAVTFKPKNIDGVKNFNILKVVVYDQVFNKTEVTVNLKVKTN